MRKILKIIARLVNIVKENGIDVVVGVGGGKILDTSKAVAYENSIPVAIVPTIASTDAPCSALSVVYSDEGVFEDYYWLPANPNLVLVLNPVDLQVHMRYIMVSQYFRNVTICIMEKKLLSVQLYN